MKETDLYPPVKAFLEAQGYEVKGEVGDCDLVAVRGSGATPSRINLLRRRDNLAGKKVVIWCMSVREFTEGAQGWRPLQILR